MKHNKINKTLKYINFILTMDSLKIIELKISPKIDIKINSDIIINKIIHILTTELNDKSKFKIEEIKVFNQIEHIKTLNDKTLNEYLKTKKLFIFDLKILGRDWTKEISYIPQNEIMRDKYENNILFMRYEKPDLINMFYFPREGKIHVNTISTFFNLLNECNSCGQLSEHVKINNLIGTAYCLKCWEKIDNVTWESQRRRVSVADLVAKNDDSTVESSSSEEELSDCEEDYRRDPPLQQRKLWNAIN